MLGDTIAQALRTIGVTPERVTEWLGKPCHCKEYQDKLNQIHAWSTRVISGKLESAQKYLDSILRN